MPTRLRRTPSATVNFAERAGNQGRNDDAGVDEDVINLERVGAPIIAGGVKRADLAGEVAFETADAGEQTYEREEKRHVEGHQKMAGRHQQRADGDGAGAAKNRSASNPPPMGVR